MGRRVACACTQLERQSHGAGSAPSGQAFAECHVDKSERFTTPAMGYGLCLLRLGLRRGSERASLLLLSKSLVQDRFMCTNTTSLFPGKL